MAKKDLLREKMNNLAHNDNNGQNTAFKPINPLSLDEQPHGQTLVGCDIPEVDENTLEVTPPRKNVRAKLPKRKWGTKNTHRYSFEITDELHEKLNKRLAAIQLTTGKKISASEIIRQALARELREI